MEWEGKPILALNLSQVLVLNLSQAKQKHII